MIRGTIRRLITDRRYGFIQSPERGDLFFHCNDLVGIAYESLREGQQVEFDIAHTPKGQAAINIVLVENYTGQSRS